jgi:hypothetical protein
VEPVARSTGWGVGCTSVRRLMRDMTPGSMCVISAAKGSSQNRSWWCTWECTLERSPSSAQCAGSEVQEWAT